MQRVFETVYMNQHSHYIFLLRSRIHSTFEALSLDFDDGQLPKLDLDRMSSLNSLLSSSVPRPEPLSSDGRVT